MRVRIHHAGGSDFACAVDQIGIFVAFRFGFSDIGDFLIGDTDILLRIIRTVRDDLYILDQDFSHIFSLVRLTIACAGNLNFVLASLIFR